jgi:hypothetical protein
MYAIFAANIAEYLFGRARTSVGYISKPLANTFDCIGPRGNIEQVLIRSGILHNRSRFPLNRKYYRALTLLELFHEVAGTSAKCRQRLDVLSDI